MSDNRNALLAKAYSRATQELRKHHAEEFHLLLQEQYEEIGITVRKRLTGERKRQADIEKARATLAALENSPAGE
jgi:hypothetical protein